MFSSRCIPTLLSTHLLEGETSSQEGSPRKPIIIEKEAPVFQFIRDINLSSGQLATVLDPLGFKTNKQQTKTKTYTWKPQVSVKKSKTLVTYSLNHVAVVLLSQRESVRTDFTVHLLVVDSSHHKGNVMKTARNQTSSCIAAYIPTQCVL